MSIIDFSAYKDTGTIKYVEEDSEIDEAVSFSEEMDSLAEVMEMSTDELIGELTIRVNDDIGIRTVDTSHLVDELTQRLLAIEYVLYMTMANSTKQ